MYNGYSRLIGEVMYNHGINHTKLYEELTEKYNSERLLFDYKYPGDTYLNFSEGIHLNTELEFLRHFMLLVKSLAEEEKI